MRAPNVLVAIAVGFASIALASPAALAQCGAPASTCRLCHDGARAPLPSAMTWHADHAFADLCVGCHMGSGTSCEAGAAHAGLVRPLEDPALSCAPCHANAPELAGRYRTIAAGPIATTPTPPRPRHGEPLPNALATIAAATIALAGGAFVIGNELRRPVRRPS